MSCNKQMRSMLTRSEHTEHHSESKSTEVGDAPEISADDERRLDDGPQRKVGALLRERQSRTPRTPHLNQGASF